MERRFSDEDAARVCDATLLALLDRGVWPTSATDDGAHLASLAATAQGVAALECERLSQLKLLHSTTTGNVASYRR